MRPGYFTAFITAIGLILSACSSSAAPPAPASTATGTPILPTPTSTPEMPPKIIMEKESECYTGPGEDSVLIATFRQGQEINLVGKDDYGEYWVVIDPASRVGCWLKREGTRAQGITDYLPNLVPPPTPFAGPPAAPQNFSAVLDSCSRGPADKKDEKTVVILLTWEYESGRASYFRIFKSGYLVTYLDAAIKQYKDAFTIRSADSGRARYSVDAYARDGGISDGVETEIEFQCR